MTLSSDDRQAMREIAKDLYRLTTEARDEMSTRGTARKVGRAIEAMDPERARILLLAAISILAHDMIQKRAQRN